MSCQVLVKFAPAANTALSFLLDSPQAREEFVQQPGIWWYHFPEEDDDWQWHRGPAWQPAHTVTAGEVLAGLNSLPPRSAHPGQVTCDEVTESGGEDDGERW